MTPHVLDQLSLWIEGDLSNQEMTLIEAHLADCPTCHEAAENLRASQAWLRESLASPFDATDAAQLRRRVMDQIRQEATSQPIQPLRVRPALLAACAASLLMTAVVWRVERGHHFSSTAIEVPPPIKDAGVRTEPASVPTLAHQPLAPLPKPRVAPIPNPDAESPPIGEPARIEFQTADPTIRIIWLAQAKPLSDANPIIQEAP